ncbi:MAG: class I SAM-dependent methyltransferase [Candidatus Paceibacteria bacterium]
MKELYDLGIVHSGDVEPFYPHVRDRADIGVLQDKQTGVIFLETVGHMTMSHYESMSDGSYWGGKTRAEALEVYREDDHRRAARFGSFITGKDFIDVGCGTGGLLDQVKSSAKSTSGVEPQKYAREELEKLGYAMYPALSGAPKESADVVSLFHVFEHLTEPLTALKEVHQVLRPEGTLILEVPHARDVLLKLEAFKAFSLWSEHLVLHTKASLKTYLETAGFRDIRIEGFQRYPLANHIGWLVDEKPGGQKRHATFDASAEAYTKLLEETDQTDTLIAFATK